MAKELPVLASEQPPSVLKPHSSEMNYSRKKKYRARHFWTWFSFFIVVAIPASIFVWYLYYRAADQYAVTVAFTVREVEDSSSAIDLIGGLASIGPTTTSETEILFEFIQSKQLVSGVDREIDLRKKYSIFSFDDPVFSFDISGTIEDLLIYWDRMITIYHDGNTGLVELEVRAFSPTDAKLIADEILSQSTEMINELSAAAQKDTTQFARDDLESKVSRLKLSRRAVMEFRVTNQIVDPSVDLQSQMGVLNSLQQTLADALVQFDLLHQITRPSDQRIIQLKNKIEVIENRIIDERAKLGGGSTGQEDGKKFSTLVGQYEELLVDQEFAETTYLNALLAYDAALAEARRQSIYLAVFIQPTVPERSEYPRRFMLISLLVGFLLLIWSIGVLAAYSVRDRF